MRPSGVEGNSILRARIPTQWPFRRLYYGWAIVLASFTATFGEVPVNGPVIGVFIKPIQNELGWSTGTIALGFTIGSIAGALSSAIVGRLVDRYGARLIVAISGALILSLIHI